MASWIGVRAGLSRHVLQDCIARYGLVDAVFTALMWYRQSSGLSVNERELSIHKSPNVWSILPCVVLLHKSVPVCTITMHVGVWWEHWTWAISMRSIKVLGAQTRPCFGAMSDSLEACLLLVIQESMPEIPQCHGEPQSSVISLQRLLQDIMTTQLEHLEHHIYSTFLFPTLTIFRH